MIDLLPALAVLLLPALIVLWVRRPRRAPLEVYTMHPAPRVEPVHVHHDLRTPEQRAADQARVNEGWGLR